MPSHLLSRASVETANHEITGRRAYPNSNSLLARAGRVV